MYVTCITVPEIVTPVDSPQTNSQVEMLDAKRGPHSRSAFIRALIELHGEEPVEVLEPTVRHLSLAVPDPYDTHPHPDPVVPPVPEPITPPIPPDPPVEADHTHKWEKVGGIFKQCTECGERVQTMTHAL